MSRYTVDTGIEVGWDPPLGQFFAQVFDEDDELVDEIGSQHLSPVLEWVNEQGFRVPEDDIRRLLDDAAQPWQPGPLQKALGFTGRS